ncbi:uncharacterized protein SCHCODRAFT_02494903, partial [Schizophyllum commune H4-8]|uniref:uncharacterized protein n=1 Tax=Schizophyllum commune (strain H4-8 / FGSC 9210) TaxID=578458 RepID=UPI00215E0244
IDDDIWYWDHESRTVYGRVIAIERLADGTQLLIIKRRQGGEISLPWVSILPVPDTELTRSTGQTLLTKYITRYQHVH